MRYRYQAVKVLNLGETISNNRLCRDESFLPRCFCSLVLIRRFDEIPGENRNNANESFDVRVRSVRKERAKPTMFEWRLPSERQHQRNRKFCHSFYFPAWACEQLGHSIFLRVTLVILWMYRTSSDLVCSMKISILLRTTKLWFFYSFCYAEWFRKTRWFFA